MADKNSKTIDFIYIEIKNYSLECNELWRKEEDLKQEHARRIARDTLPNIYHLSAPRQKETPAWRIKHGLIARKDLIPAIHQNAGREDLFIVTFFVETSCESTRLIKQQSTTVLVLASFDLYIRRM
ncbi:unnamed protein product [Diatraea saccharalis]|uniref:Uncharacterized protein n=1 Tax=Diatraea saccharalis TaxID=40085 RepID=A0A9N9QZH7_9NEOP|nr:unnamed protein product [Diatraea saccharalis]